MVAFDAARLNVSSRSLSRVRIDRLTNYTGPASGASEDAPISSSQSTGAFQTDAIWKLLNEADDQKSTWYAMQWGQWFVRLVDAVAQLENDATRSLEKGDNGTTGQPDDKRGSKG